MKKLFSLVLALALVLSCVPAVWGANETADITGTNGAWPDLMTLNWSGDCAITIGPAVISISGNLNVPNSVTKLTIICNNTGLCTAGTDINLIAAPADFELVFTGGGRFNSTGAVSYADSLSITGTPNVTLGSIIQIDNLAPTLTLQDVTCGAVFLRGDGSILEVRGACSLRSLESSPGASPGSSFTLLGEGELTIGALATMPSTINFLGQNLNLDFSGDLTLKGGGGTTPIINVLGGTLNFLSLPNSLTMEVNDASGFNDLVWGTIDFAPGLASIPGLEDFGLNGAKIFRWPTPPTPPTPPTTPPAPETAPRPRDFGSTGGDYWPSLETLIPTPQPAEKQNPGMGGK